MENTEQNAIEFFIENGRFPQITDAVKPWQRSGWLFLYAQRFGICRERWNWYTDYLTRFAPYQFPETMPPKLKLTSDWNGNAVKQLNAASRLIKEYTDSWNAIRSLLEWLGWGLGVYQHEPDIKPEIAEKLYRTFNLQPMIEFPADYLGYLLSEDRAGKKNPTGFYPTPHSICEIIVQMMMPQSESPELLFQSVCDPAVGTGRMLLHASNQSLLLYGCDIDPVCVLACKINGVLYAPWMIQPPQIPQNSIPLPPNPLPLPETHQYPEDSKILRIDDFKQQSLFNFRPEKQIPKSLKLKEKINKKNEGKSIVMPLFES